MADGWRVAQEIVSLEQAMTGLGALHQQIEAKLARRLVDLRPMRWSSLKRLAPRGADYVDVERVVDAWYRAGRLSIRYRADSRGELKPTQLRLRATAGEAVSRLIRRPEPVLEPLIAALLERRDSGAGRIPERLLVQRTLGDTKALRLRDHRAEIEAAIGVPLERLVRFHADSVLTAGPARYRFRGVDVDLRGSWPWAAITEPVAQELTDLVGASEILCVENQTVFEALIDQEPDALIVFTAGFLGPAARAWLTRLIEAGARRLRHWGDLDPWGLDIYRDLRDHALSANPRLAVEPWRMDAALLSRPDVRPLTPEDWAKLHHYLARPGVPMRGVAEAMRERGVKLEQEALLE